MFVKKHNTALQKQYVLYLLSQNYLMGANFKKS